MWFTTFVLLAAFSMTKGRFFDVTTNYDVGDADFEEEKGAEYIVDVFDVTTIYDVGDADFEEEKAAIINGRTHARTNALGLPVCERKDNCNAYPCHPNQFRCASGECIQRRLKCDFYRDCLDGSDEENCPYECSLPHFRCTSGNCIPLAEECNGIINCQDGSDEEICLPSTTREGSPIISPIFSPDSSQLCLVLVVYSLDDHSDDILHILAEDIYQSEYQLEAINNVKAGRNIKRANITLHKNMSSPIKLIIRKVGTLETQIDRISSCSIEGEEVENVFQVSVISDGYTLTLSYAPEDLPVYTVWSEDIGTSPALTEDFKTNHCVNGGVMTPAGCACPPGFSGQKCQFGCGKNSFGQDCGGLCSFRLRECEGLLLCTKQTGCQCAPGYQGINCNEQCSSGWYGNNCSQPCGHCAIGFSSSSICDIYTGECSSCEPGYIPPSCKQAYVYYSLIPELSTPDYNQITVTLDPLAYTSANGKPELYQIQYREKDGEWRTYVSKKMPKVDDVKAKHKISETIEGLQMEVVYQVRVLLMDGGFNKYYGDLVQSAEIITKCDIPEGYDYNVTAVTNSTSLSFSWSYVNDTEHWCSLISYEVSWKEGWKWSSSEVSQEDFSLTGFVSGVQIKFRVRAKTSGGFAPYSKTGVYSTNPQGTSAVLNLRMLSSTSSSVEVSWEPPRDSKGRKLQYTVTYKCVEQPACSPGCLNATEGHLTVDETSATLNHLLPFAQYQVIVTPQDGLKARIYVGTSEVVPTEVPVVSAQKHVLRTNTSLSVFWNPVPVCSSFLLGYNYELVKESLGLKMLANGFTKDTTASFHNLTASTEYSVKVYVLTVAGWNPESFLSIKTSTSATA